MTGELPPGWTRAPLHELFENLDSRRIPVNAAERAERLASRSDRYPYFGATGQVGEIDSFLLEGECVLLGEDGAPFLDPRKHKAYLVDGRYWVNNHAHILRAHEPLSNGFFCHQLNVIDYRPYVAGTTRLKLTQAAMNDIELVVAPAEEQQRIVSRIDELFSLIEEGERALDQVQKLVERYRQSVLKAAVTGELTRDWREKHEGKAETGDVLLARILKARREAWEKTELDKMKAKGVTPVNDQWKLKYEEPSPPDITDLPEFPEGWVWGSLDQFAAPVERAIQSGPFGSNLLHSEFQSTGKLVIGIDNVRDGWFSLGARNRISEEKFTELKKYAARPKDFLITVMATIGRTCVVPEDIEPAIITKHVYRFTLDQNLVLPEFVNLCVMGSPAVRSQMFGKVQGQTRPGLNKSILIRFGFPLPSIQEQRQILDRSAELLSQIEPFEEGLDSQLRLSASLRQTVLRSAFCGDLVPHDSRDEPASVLLERIAVERGSTPTNSSRSPKNKSKTPA